MVFVWTEQRTYSSFAEHNRINAFVHKAIAEPPAMAMRTNPIWLLWNHFCSNRKGSDLEALRVQPNVELIWMAIVRCSLMLHFRTMMIRVIIDFSFNQILDCWDCCKSVLCCKHFRVNADPLKICWPSGLSSIMARHSMCQPSGSRPGDLRQCYASAQHRLQIIAYSIS